MIHIVSVRLVVIHQYSAGPTACCCCLEQLMPSPPFHAVQAAEMVATIQLGINSSRTSTAAAAASILPQLPNLPADAVAELLLTAIARQPVNSALEQLLAAGRDGWNLRQLTVEQLLAVMQQVAATSTRASATSRTALQSLGWMITVLPAAYQISAETMAGLLHTMIEADSPDSCYIWMSWLPTYADIDTEQLARLLQLALGRLATSSHPALYFMTKLPAFQHLTTAQVASIVQVAVAAAAAAAAAAAKKVPTPSPAAEGGSDAASNTASLHMLCASIVQADAVAGRGTAAVKQWLLPAVKAALSAGLPEHARVMVLSTQGVLGTDEVMVLMQGALQAGHTGALLSGLFQVPAADSLHAKDVLQLLRSVPAGSSKLGTSAYFRTRRAILRSKAWSRVSAEDKLCVLLPMLLPWLGYEYCRNRLQTVEVAADMTAKLAEEVCGMWAWNTSPWVPMPIACGSHMHGGCWTQLRAGRPVLCCDDLYSSSCAAMHLSMVLLSEAPATEHQ
jgi:hypothetical protein